MNLTNPLDIEEHKRMRASVECRRLKIRNVLHSPLIETETRRTNEATKTLDKTKIKVPSASKLADDLIQQLVPIFDEHKRLEIQIAIRLPSKSTNRRKTKTEKYTAGISTSIATEHRFPVTLSGATETNKSDDNSTAKIRTTKCVFPVQISDQIVLCDDALFNVLFKNGSDSGNAEVVDMPLNQTLILDQDENTFGDIIDDDSPTSAADQMSLAIDEPTRNSSTSLASSTLTPLSESGSLDVSNATTAMATTTSENVKRPVGSEKSSDNKSADIWKRSDIVDHIYVVQDRSKIALPNFYNVSTSESIRSTMDPFLTSPEESEGEISSEDSKQSETAKTESSELENKSVNDKKATEDKSVKDDSSGEQESTADKTSENQNAEANQEDDVDKSFQALLSNLNMNSANTRSDICPCCGFKRDEEQERRKQQLR